MIARYSLLLPFEFTMDAELVLPPLTLSLGGERIVVHQPQRALLDTRDLHPAAEAPIGEAPLKLLPAPPTPIHSLTVDGKPAILANLLIVDFLRDRFERRRDAPLDQPSDPPFEHAVAAANEVLRRIRLLARVSNARILNPDDVLWLLRYLKTDETPVDDDPVLYREKWVALHDWKLAGITPRLWQAVSEAQGESVTRVWEDLLLDADALFSEAGAAIVLAHSALETFSKATLDRLARRSATPVKLWEFFFQHKREPRMEVQLDVLLEAFTGHSLKERNDLWQAFKQLQEARNSFAHRGQALIKGQPVTRDDLSRMLAATRDTIDWVETFLPLEWRRPVYLETATFALDKATFEMDDPRMEARVTFESRGLRPTTKTEMP
jgi:hypothetical protein